MVGREPAAGGQPEAQLGIAWQRDAWQAHLPAGEALRHAEAGGFVALPRPDHGEAVSAQGEAIDQAAEGHGDAVDFGSVGFGDEGEVQRVLPGGGRRTGRRAPAA